MRSLPIELADDELLCIVGPTASQKTELAMRVCEEIGGEILNADSVQIYKHFNVGSGKPTAEQRARVVHHLVDRIDPDAHIDAARFGELAHQTVFDVRVRGRVPVVCGGSFLWIRALVYGLATAPGASTQFRAEIRSLAEQFGVEFLHKRLAQADPVTASRLSPRDLVRIERALEVLELTGKPISQLHAEHVALGARHKARFVGIAWDKDALVQRIERRAAEWLAAGWIDEVEGLAAIGYRDARPMRSVGYRQVLAFVEGRLQRGDLLPQIVRSTKVFARRQRTWLRGVPVHWVSPP